MAPTTSGNRKSATMVLLVLGAALIAVAGVAIGLANGSSDDRDQSKQDILNRLAATRSAAIAYASEHPEDIPTKHPSMMPTIEPSSWSVGIVEEGGAPVAAMAFGAQNHWSWDLEGNHVVVYAGHEGSDAPDPGRGALIVLVRAMDLSAVPELSGSYLAPAGAGSLHVVSYEGSLLTLQASTGETFHFDAETRAFTDADGNPVPTDTPTPTPHVYPTNNSTLPPLPTATPVPTATPTSAPLATAQPNAG